MRELAWGGYGVEEAPDRDLILACRKGRQDAWKRLLGKYERLVFSVPLRYGLSRDDAADVAQVTFTILLEKLDGLPEDSRLGAWLTTVAKRHTWRRMERNRREGSVAGDQLEGTALAERAVLLGKSKTDSIEHWELTEWLEGGLAQLGGSCRELLLTLYFQPETPSYAEVAERLGMPVGSIGPTRGRCLKRLKRILDEGQG